MFAIRASFTEAHAPRSAPPHPARPVVRPTNGQRRNIGARGRAKLRTALSHDEFRVLHIVDPASGRCVYELEHEIRSLAHPAFSGRAWLVCAPATRALFDGGGAACDDAADAADGGGGEERQGDGQDYQGERRSDSGEL